MQSKRSNFHLTRKEQKKQSLYSGTLISSQPSSEEKQTNIVRCLRPSSALCATWENQQPASDGITIENVGRNRWREGLHSPMKIQVIHRHDAKFAGQQTGCLIQLLKRRHKTLSNVYNRIPMGSLKSGVTFVNIQTACNKNN